MRCGILWVQLECLLKIALRSKPIPVVRESHERARCVSFSQRRICIDSLLRRCFRFRHFIDGPCDTDVGKKSVRISQSGESEGECRVLLFSTFEVVDAVAKSFFVTFVPEVPALQIKLIRFSIFCVSLGQLLFTLA